MKATIIPALPVSVMTLAAPAAAISVAGSTTSPTGVYCEPAYTPFHTAAGSRWHAYDAGTLVNRSAGTISRTFTHSRSAAFSTTASAEVGASTKTIVAEVNAKFGISTSETASFTTFTSFTVTAPPWTRATYKDGILVRSHSARAVQTCSNCATRTTCATAQVADNCLEAR